MIEETAISIHPVRTGEEQALLTAAALADGHAVFSPSNVIMKGDNIVGSLDINTSPTVFLWMHKDKTNFRDAQIAHGFYEAICRNLGAKYVVVPCPRHSPFYKLLSNPKSGYVEAQDNVVFMKQLRK